jgi:putative colanic acid biosynthesis acetyltransferase WcaF
MDMASNRKAVKYSKGILTMRVLWSAAVPLFRHSPRTFFRWRAFLLRLFGAKIGKDVHIYNSSVIYMPWNLEIGDWSSIGEYAFIYNLGKVTIGKAVTISHRAHLCAGTHDYSDPTMSLLRPPISIRNQAWICTDAYLGPGIVVGEGAVVGACGVAVKDVEPWSIVAGNPARVIGRRALKDCRQEK